MSIKPVTAHTTSTTNAKTYLALGDSYTIGEAVKQEESFPFQLAQLLKDEKVDVGKPKVVARTGWTTGELQAQIAVEGLKPTYDLVTLLIGVNNQYRGNSKAVYQTEFAELLRQAIAFAKGNRKHVFVVSIPDWSVTPFGKSSGVDQQKIAREIDEFNAINKSETLAAGVTYIEITAESRKAAADRSLIAEDGLHPSAKMYSFWAKAVLAQSLAVLK